MKQRGIQVKYVLFFLAAVYLFLCMAHPVHAENVISLARQNVITHGEWREEKEGIRFYRNDNRYIRSAWCMIDHNVYRFNGQGYVETGSFTYDQKSYRSDRQGKLYINCMVTVGSNQYYYAKNGKMASAKWLRWKGKWYYFSRSGKMQKNAWISNYYVGDDGARVKNKTIDGRKLDGQGKIEKISKKDRVIIVGASRIVDMSVIVDDPGVVFLAEAGKGIKWLKSRGGPRLKRYLDANPDVKVVFQLGNNDAVAVEKYIDYYKRLMRRYPDTEFYFMDALPCDTKYEKHNPKNQYFNDMMLVTFGDHCIGGYDYLCEMGVETVDGMHYTDAITRKLYRYIMNQIA